jgi:hypothetical protein
MTNAAEQAFLDLLFLNIDWANVGDASGLQNSAAAGNFWISLHTADPGEGGSQTTNETSYSGYARASVARSGSGWSRTGSIISNVSAINFGTCSSGTATITHFGVGTDSTSTGNLLFKGSLTSSLAVSLGIAPSFVAGALTVEVD